MKTVKNYKRFLRFICLLVAFSLVIRFSEFTASASSKSYKITDLGIQCTIPDTFTLVFSRDSIKTDDDVASLGLTKAEVLQLFSESNIYLEAGTKNFETDFRITMVPSTLDDFSTYGDTLLQGLASEMVDGLKAYSYSVISWEIYHHPDTEFIVVQYSLPAYAAYSYGIQYYTVMNMQAINFTCLFLSRPTSSDKAMLKGIIDSALFENAPAKTSEEDAKHNYPAFNYSDNYVSFHLPDGWKQTETDPSHTSLNAKFQRGENADVIFTYGCIDVWSQLSTYEKQSLSRADCSFSSMTNTEITDTISGEYENNGIVINNSSVLEVSGKKCAQATFTTHGDAYGIPLEVTTTQVTFLENGYMISFTISQDSSSKYYSEFIRILESVKFQILESDHSNTNSSNQPSSAEPSKSKSGGSFSERNTFLYVLCGGAVMVVLAIAIIIIVRKRAAKTQVDSLPYSVIDNKLQNDTASSQLLFCHKCGARLVAGKNVCQNCGASIPR